MSRNAIFILNKVTGEYSFYGSLKPKLLDAHPELKEGTVNNYISRKKQPYEDNKYKIWKGKLK